MTKVFIISGRTGAGKTTVAKKLAEELPAFRFSHDEVLQTVFGSSIADKDFQTCCRRVNEMIWRQVAELLKLNVSIVLEGWGGRKLRDEVRDELSNLGAEYQFLFVACPTGRRRGRVLKRNENQGTEGDVIDEAAFSQLEKLREEFGPDEECLVIDNSENDQLVDLSFIKSLR